MVKPRYDVSQRLRAEEDGKSPMGLVPLVQLHQPGAKMLLRYGENAVDDREVLPSRCLLPLDSE